MAAYMGTSELEMSPYERIQIIEVVEQVQSNRMTALEGWVMDMLSIDGSDATYHSFRSTTTTGLEVGSLVAGGYGAVKGVISFSKLAKMPMQFTKMANKVRKSSLQRIDNSVKAIEEFLGGKGKVITNADGDMILIRGDRKIRFDIKDPHGEKPHFHLEKKNPKGKWVDARPEHRYYFTEE